MEDLTSCPSIVAVCQYVPLTCLKLPGNGIPYLWDYWGNRL